LIEYFGVQNWQKLLAEKYDGADVKPVIKALLAAPDDIFLTNLQTEIGEEIMKALVAIGDTTIGQELVEFVLSLRGNSNLGWQINPYVLHLIPDGGLLETYLRALDKKTFHYPGHTMPILADVTRRLGVRVYKERYGGEYEVRAVS
jgi:hypothetical protein